MFKNRLLVVLAAAIQQTTPAAAGECMYDQPNQLEKLRGVAASKPGARVDADARAVLWTSKDKAHWSLVYGGCDHLGLAITSTKIKSLASKPTETLQAAVKMAVEFFDPVDAADLKKAIDQKKYQIHTNRVSTYFSIENESYDVFEIEQEFKEHAESLTVRWIRSF